MDRFKNKKSYLKYFEHNLRDAGSRRQHLVGKKNTTYEDISTYFNTDAFSLSVVKNIFSDQCFEHIQSYRLDLNLGDIRMLQITLNTIEKYWYSGIFQGMAYRDYKNKIKEFKKFAYASIGLDYYSSRKIIEVPILPHVMKGLLRRYYTKINMPKETIDIIFTIFDGNKPQMRHKDIKKIESLCDALATKLGKNIIMSESDLYPYIIEHFGQDYFITKDPDRSRWDEWRPQLSSN